MKFAFKHFKKIILVVFSFIFFCSCFLRTFEAMQMHQGIIILIDQDNTETIERKKVQSMTSRLIDGISSKALPIIVSSSLLYNMVKRKISWNDPAHKENEYLRNVSFSQNEWEIYDVPKTQFLLLILKRDKEKIKKCFNINVENSIDAFEIDSYKNLLTHLDSKNKNLNKFQVSDFKTIFKIIDWGVIKEAERKGDIKTLTQLLNRPKLYLFLAGHGMKDLRIAGLPVKDMQELLEFFNYNLYVAMLFINSCYLAGTNLDLIKFQTELKNDKILRSLNYDIFIQGIDDVFTNYLGINYAVLAQKAYQLGKKEISLQDFTLAVYYPKEGVKLLKPIKDVIHGHVNIPQFLIRGGLDFQVPDIDKRIKVIGPVLLRIHQEENEPIILWPYKGEFPHLLEKQKILPHLRCKDYIQATLIYPLNINVPIWINSRQVKDISATTFEKLKKEQWIDFPSLRETISYVNENKDFKNDLDNYSLALEGKMEEYANDPEKLTKVKIAKDFEKKLESLKDSKSFYIPKQEYIFPIFVPMKRGDSIQRFSTIRVFNKIENGKESIFGVHKGLRDVFFDISGRLVKRTFLIDKWIGYNDLYDLLNIIRAIDNVKSFIQILKGEAKNQELDLETCLLEKKCIDACWEKFKITKNGDLESKLEKYKRKEITLEKVIITTDWKDGKIVALISFEFEGGAWEFDSRKAMGKKWKFIQKDIHIHRQKYKELEKGAIVEERFKKAPHQFKPIPSELQKFDWSRKFFPFLSFYFFIKDYLEKWKVLKKENFLNFSKLFEHLRIEKIKSIEIKYKKLDKKNLSKSSVSTLVRACIKDLFYKNIVVDIIKKQVGPDYKIKGDPVDKVIAKITNFIVNPINDSNSKENLSKILLDDVYKYIDDIEFSASDKQRLWAGVRDKIKGEVLVKLVNNAIGKIQVAILFVYLNKKGRLSKILADIKKQGTKTAFETEKEEDSIVLLNQKDKKDIYPLQSLFNFIYQSYVGEKRSFIEKEKRLFLIKELVGNNGLSLFLEFLRYENNINVISELEKVIGPDSQNINVKNVIASLGVEENKVAFDLTFDIKNTAWNLSVKIGPTSYDTVAFALTELNPQLHQQNFDQYLQSIQVPEKRQKAIAD